MVYSMIKQLLFLFCILLYMESSDRSLDYQWSIITVFVYRLLLCKNTDKKMLLYIVIILKSLLIPVSFVTFSFICSLNDYDWICENIKVLYDLCFDLKIHRPVLPIKTPVIYMCNYPETIFEYNGIHMLSNKMCMVAGRQASTYIKQFWDGMNVIPVDQDKTKNLSNLFKQSKIMNDKGYDLFVYPENRKNQHREIKRKTKYKSSSKLQSGFFVISKKLNIPIVPVVFSRIKHINGIVFDNDLDIYIGNPLYTSNIKDTMKRVDNFFTKHLI